MRVLAIILVLAVAAISAFPQAKTREQVYSFRQGVTLNHWTNTPIEGWTFADPRWFSEKDVKWIADRGIDHIQLYVSAKDVFRPDDSPDIAKLAAVDSLVDWSREAGLGIILTLTASQLPDSVDRQIKLWGKFAEHFRSSGDNVRFLIGYPAKGEIGSSNIYYQRSTTEIRRSSAKRMIYLTAASTESLSELVVPKDDPYIGIAARMAAWPPSEALDVFLYQHVFEQKLPRIAFPSTIPKMDDLVAQADNWAVKFSGMKLDEKYLDIKFKKVSAWMKRNQPHREFYLSHWRYVTGWPFVPDSVKDERSIRNFAKAFRKSTLRNQINWSVYDYNSGSPVRYSNGDEALILRALDLRPNPKK